MKVRLSNELIATLLVLLAATIITFYFGSKDDQQISLVCAARDITCGQTMSADDLKVVTCKRGELPDWLRSEAEFPTQRPKDDTQQKEDNPQAPFLITKAEHVMRRAQPAKSVYMYASKTNQVVGFPASMNIYQGQILYKYVYDKCGNYLGTDPPKPMRGRR